jgi:tetratricopeptide (TPR) repeat protein
MLKRVIRQIFAGARAPAPVAIAHADDGVEMVAAAHQCLAAGDTAGAQACARAALASRPDHAEAHRLLGMILGQAGRLDEARAALETAVRLEPGHVATLGDLGNVLRLSGDLAGADVRYSMALALDPGDRAARMNRASLYSSQGRDAEALADYKSALGSAPDPAALKGAVGVLDRMGDAAGALALCRCVLAEHPDHAEAHASAGFVLLKRELAPEAALPHLERAIAADPGDFDSLGNLGIALQDLGRLDEAIVAYDRVLAAQPDHRLARFHRALAFLLRGEFGRAWPDYELRLLSDDRPPRRFPAPRWQGEDLAGRTILVHAEQGLGDEMMFASCLPDLLARAKHVVVDCSPKLAGLVARSFPTATVHGGGQYDDTGWLANAPKVDYVVPAGSLPLHLRPSLASFPRHGGYLVADPLRVEAWRSRLDALGPGLKIGLSWRGGMPQSRRALRSIDPAALAPLVAVPGTHFVDLQHDGRPEELRTLTQVHGLTVHHWPEALADYEETAALVASLDLVVSVCTAVIHLGGALGRPVWVLAPFSPEWRYGIAGEAMPWYPSVIVLRQPARDDWDGVLAAALARLRALAP